MLIKQDIFSQVLVANLLQAFINDSDEELKKLKYKHKAKTNKNMAIGIFKDKFIYILLEDDMNKKTNMYNELIEEKEKYVVYEIPNRKKILEIIIPKIDIILIKENLFSKYIISECCFK